MRKKFIRVFLKSGSELSPMGEEEIAIYCQCDNENPSVDNVDIKKLEIWVNRNIQCKKNQSSDRYIVSNNLGSIDIIVLEEREIQSCHKANRIFPRMLNFCPGA